MEKWLRGRSSVETIPTPAREEFWALRDISLDIRQGDVVGIIGRNGAGKSTLLKLISRITKPTTGRMVIDGSVASLLEVGAAFHLELTGRENIFLNGAVLGMKRSEIIRKFDSIVEFAEIARFLDVPVKRYSSGMFVRLAFSIAAHVEPDIFIVDEVLAIGDAGFQKKCLAKMEEVARQGGHTILFVSHNMGAIKGLCTRGIWLDRGHLKADGAVEEVVACYLKNVFERGPEAYATAIRDGDQFCVTRVVLKNRYGTPTMEFGPGDSLTVCVHFVAPQRYEQPRFWLGVHSQFGPLFGAGIPPNGHLISHVEGEGVLECTFPQLPLLPQPYSLWMEAWASNWAKPLMPPQEIGSFMVTGRMRDFGLLGDLADIHATTSSPLVLPYEWRFPDKRVVTVHASEAIQPGVN
jgi:lipopolysaccharide transport system ATP-binding protein